MVIKSLNTIVDNLAEIFAGGDISDEYKPSKRQLKWIVLNWRAANIRRDLDKGNVYYDSIRQDLGIIDLEQIDKSECPDVPSGCSILRTVNKVPTPLRLKSGEDIQVYFTDKVTNVTSITSDEIDILKYRKFTSREIYWFKRNGYIYVVGSAKARMLKHINIRGSFENPLLAGNFGCKTNDCFTDDSEFPIPMDMLPLITQAIMSQEFKMKVIPEDYENDGVAK